jgi:hypothetical protein
MLEQVARMIRMIGLSDLPPNCRPQSAQPWRLGKRKIPDGLRDRIKHNLIVEAENLLGYPFQHEQDN